MTLGIRGGGKAQCEGLVQSCLWNGDFKELKRVTKKRELCLNPSSCTPHQGERARESMANRAAQLSFGICQDGSLLVQRWLQGLDVTSKTLAKHVHRQLIKV